MALVVGLTFLFGFGNVWLLALRLGVPVYVAPLVAPAVDLSVLGLLIAIRELAVRGAPRAEIRPARRLLVFAGCPCPGRGWIRGLFWVSTTPRSNRSSGIWLI
ncbi:hypothetical protein [Frankia sp. CeD]